MAFGVLKFVVAASKPRSPVLLAVSRLVFKTADRWNRRRIQDTLLCEYLLLQILSLVLPVFEV
jgi:hypothetical protein